MQPYSNACENNKVPILNVLQSVFNDVSTVLEIGTGTAQHAVYFAPSMPHLTWQTSDVIDNHPGIMSWLDALPASNLLPPLELDLRDDWQIAQYDAVFTSNTLHIIDQTLVVAFFSKISQCLNVGGKLCIYGPFNYGGQFTSESNAEFDNWLKVKSPNSGVRDFEWICELAKQAKLALTQDHTMPANNRLLEFVKR
jgi:cyclopropane fatty-acyl-phospholipid synthase-like methyltransferase